MHQDEVSKQIEAFAFARKRSEMHRMIVKAIRSAPDDRDFLFSAQKTTLPPAWPPKPIDSVSGWLRTMTKC